MTLFNHSIEYSTRDYDGSSRVSNHDQTVVTLSYDDGFAGEQLCVASNRGDGGERPKPAQELPTSDHIG